jgi:toxin-antitoxin system PIN domain toxin
MISVDTNILLYAYDRQCEEHALALAFIESCARRTDLAICELVLVELYTLLRNPAVLRRPLKPSAAVEVCQAYRRNRNWEVVDYPGNLMDAIWREAGSPQFARRRIYDARLALTLGHHGVTDFATRNSRHFDGYGFRRVFDPIAGEMPDEERTTPTGGR